MKKRFVVSFLFLLAVFYAPWWVNFLIGVFATFVFPPYYEILFFGFLFDMLYSTNTSFGFGVIGFAVSVGLFFGMAQLKKALRAS